MAGIVYLRIFATDGVLISLSIGDGTEVETDDSITTVSSDTAAAIVSIDAAAVAVFLTEHQQAEMFANLETAVQKHG